MAEPYVVKEISFGVWKILCQKENLKEIKKKEKRKKQNQKKCGAWKILKKRINVVYEIQRIEEKSDVLSMSVAFALYALGAIK